MNALHSPINSFAPSPFTPARSIKVFPLTISAYVSRGIISYFVGSSPFFDIGIESIPINSGSKNVYILEINNATIKHQLNGNSTNISTFQTGTPRAIEMIQQYRLGGFINRTNFFNGCQYFFWTLE